MNNANHTNDQPKQFYVTWLENAMTITAKTSHAAVKVFRDAFPQACEHIKVNNNLYK